MNREITISNTVFNDSPSFAYAILGYCEGRLKEKCNPPKGSGRSTYLVEYLRGLESNVPITGAQASGESPC